MLNSVVPLRCLKHNTLYKIITRDPYPSRAKTVDSTSMLRCRVRPYNAGDDAQIVTIYLPRELVSDAYGAGYFMFRGVHNITFIKVIGETMSVDCSTRINPVQRQTPTRSEEHTPVCPGGCPRGQKTRFCSSCSRLRHPPNETCYGRFSRHSAFCDQCGGLLSSCSSCAVGAECREMEAYHYLNRIHREDVASYRHPVGEDESLRANELILVFSHRSMIQWTLGQTDNVDIDYLISHPCTEFSSDCTYCFLLGEYY